MQTLDLGSLPPALAAEIERRRATGADHHDEVWDGEYVMAPSPTARHGSVQMQVAFLLDPAARSIGLTLVGEINIGTPTNHRVPDLSWVRAHDPDAAYQPTAALVVEVLSPRDRTWEKLDHYAAHAVEEVVIVDPAARAVTWLVRDGDGTGYLRHERSVLLGRLAVDVAAAIDWP